MTLTLTNKPTANLTPCFMKNDLVEFMIDGVEYHGAVKRVNKKTVTISPVWKDWVYMEGGLKVDPQILKFR